jgi:hypothetical protein
LTTNGLLLLLLVDPTIAIMSIACNPASFRRTDKCIFTESNSVSHTAGGIRHADHVAPLPAKVGITSPTSGGRSVGIVRSRTQTMDFFF